jgi:hypothetical protein
MILSNCLLGLEPKSNHEAQQHGNRLGNFGLAERPRREV